MDIKYTTIKRRFFLIALGSFITSIMFASCSQQQAQVTSNTIQATQKEVIQVGVTGITSEDILKFVNNKLASQQELEIKVVTFNDWIQPNTALRDRVIDANFFQHKPFMNNAAKELKLNLVSLNTVSLSTLGLFSKRFKSVNEVPQNSTVTIANDVINNFSSSQTVALAGITPHSMGQETAKDTKYALALVTLQGRENEPKIQNLNKLLNDPQLRDSINKQYQGRIIPVF